MINPVVIPFITRVTNGIFQQDNTILHTAVHIRKALEKVRILDWLAWSPNLSPIEHVWNDMGRPTSSLHELTPGVSGMARNSARLGLYSEAICFHATPSYKSIFVPVRVAPLTVDTGDGLKA